MKRLSLFLFSALLIFSNSCIAAVTFDQAIIEKKALEIEQKLKQDRYLMCGLTAFAVTYGIYQWMPFLMHMMANQSAPAPKENKVPTPEEQKPAEKFSLSQSIKSGMWSFGTGIYGVFHDVFCTKESWVSMLQFTLSVTGANIISQISEQYIHPDTLRWYINAHAPYPATIAMIKEKMYEQPQIGKEVLLLLHNRLVRQAMLICAYMTYKIKYLDDAEKIIGERAKMAMLKAQQKWLTDIEVQLNATECDLAMLENTLDAYADIVIKHVDHFSRIAGETKRERDIVKRKMKQE